MGCCAEDSGNSYENCLISINSSIITDYNDYGCDDLVGGSRVGNLNVSGYASDTVYVGCPGRAGAQVLWVKKYSCDTDETFLIYTGPGRSFIQDTITGYASLGVTGESSTIMRSAQAGSVGSAIDTEQREGLGLSYTGTPFGIDTSTKLGSIVNISIGSMAYDCYLQSFNLDCSPGSIPVASYSFLFTLNAND